MEAALFGGFEDLVTAFSEGDCFGDDLMARYLRWFLKDASEHDEGSDALSKFRHRCFKKVVRENPDLLIVLRRKFKNFV